MSEATFLARHYLVVRIFKLFVTAVASLAVIAIASPLLFWLGRSQTRRMDQSLLEHDVDDAGTDIDELN